MPRQPSEDALIWQCARKHYEARQHRVAGGQWGSLSQEARDVEFDAMWNALHELLVPSEDMLGAALSADWSAYPLGESHAVLFRAMISKLLEA